MRVGGRVAIGSVREVREMDRKIYFLDRHSGLGEDVSESVVALLLLLRTLLPCHDAPPCPHVTHLSESFLYK